jgi:imidazolonepropionase-like amidohydrolase
MRSIAIALLAAALPALAAPPVTAIVGGTVITITKGTFKGTVILKDGKIAEIGENVSIPAGAEKVDATGMYVMPGIIDPHSHIAAEATNEGSISVASMVDINDVINPEDIAIYRALAGGVTTIVTLHGSADTIGGQCATIKMRWGKDAEGLKVQGAPPILKFALGENVKRAGSSQQRINIPGLSMPQAPLRYPGTRMGVEDVLRQSFLKAKAYQAEWKEYNDQVKAGQHPIPPRRDLQLEPLVAVLEGRMLVHTHAYRQDEILMFLKVGDEFGFRTACLIHCLEGYKVAKEIAAHKAGVTTFSDWWDYKIEARDAIPYNAAIMLKKGVDVSLHSDDAQLMRHLNQEAAKIIRYGGISENEALSLITIAPARQIGLDKRIGSLEVGKDADVVIYDKHPLSNYAKVQKVFIDGIKYFDRDTDISGRAAKEARKKALIQKEQEMMRRAAPPTRRPA